MFNFNLIYFVTNKQRQFDDFGEEVNTNFNNLLAYEDMNFDNLILDKVVENLFMIIKENKNIKRDFKNMLDSITPYKYVIHKIDIISQIQKKDLAEYETLDEIDKSIKEILLNPESFTIITIDNNNKAPLRELLEKEKIYENILFNSDYDRPVENLMEEYISNL